MIAPAPLGALCDIALQDDLQTRFAVTFANDEPGAIRILPSDAD